MTVLGPGVRIHGQDNIGVNPILTQLHKCTHPEWVYATHFVHKFLRMPCYTRSSCPYCCTEEEAKWMHDWGVAYMNRYDVPLKGDARDYLLNWIQVREARDLARSAEDMSSYSRSTYSTSHVVTHRDPIGAHLDPRELLEYVQQDLAEVDAMYLTVAATRRMFPYFVGSLNTLSTSLERITMKRNNALRDARAAARCRDF